MENDVIKGTIKKLKKIKDDFNIAFIKSDDIPTKYITDFGTFVVQGSGTLTEKEEFTFTGKWEFNPKYKNWTFKFYSYERKIPENDEEIISYLQSEIFKGVGPTLAERIVKAFGEKTLEIIENEPERLKEIEGIGLKKYEKLMESYNVEESFKNLTKILSVPPINMSTKMISKIYTKLGKTALYKIEENPYILCEEIDGIGFGTADLVAKTKFNVELTDEKRLRAGLLYALKESAYQFGHVYLPIKELYIKFKKLFPEIGIQDFNSTIRLYNNIDIKLEVDKKDSGNSPVYLKKYYRMEQSLSKSIKGLISECNKISELEQFITELQEETGITYAEKQLDALKQLNKSNFFVITGGPGTGKSTIINGILKVLEKDDINTGIIMAAPTGRASKRMEEATKKKAATIHRTLEYNPREGFVRNENNPLECEVIIVDEFSMVDMPLMCDLMKAIEMGTKIILVGDIDQLPPVGVGYVLRDIIQSKVVPVIRLNQVFRQEKDSLIKVNAQNIREGNINLETADNEFEIIEETDLQTLQEIIIGKYIDCLYEEKEQTGSIEKGLYNTQVLTPTKKGPLGTFTLNEKLQDLINPNNISEMVFIRKEDGESKTLRFRVGDKIMQMVNNYEKEVFNGDLGIIDSIDTTDEPLIKIMYEDGKLKEYTAEELRDEVSLAYATTIHKSQGSEYSNVIMAVSSAHNFMNQRNLLYTGITRAKRKVIICGERKAVEFSINTVRSVLRYTKLTELLKDDLKVA